MSCLFSGLILYLLEFLWFLLYHLSLPLSLSLSPNWPCLLKSLSASAAPAASDSLCFAAGRRCLQESKHTHTVHTPSSVEISQPPWTGGGLLKNDNNSAHDCKERVTLNTIFKGSHHISINPLTHPAFSPPLWACIAALSQVVMQEETLVMLHIISGDHNKHTGNLSHINVSQQL